MNKKLLIIASSLAALSLSAQVPVLSPIQGASVNCSQPALANSYSVVGTNNPTQFNWMTFPNTGVNIGNPNASSTSISFPNTSGVYTITCYASNSSGPSSIVSKTVQVFETPTVTFSGNARHCQGSATLLQASPTLISASSTLTYTWAPTAGVLIGALPYVALNPSVTTTYTLFMTLGICSNNAAVTITVDPTPTISASVDKNPICKGEKAQLTIQGNADFYFVDLVPTPTVSFLAPTASTIYVIGGANTASCTAITAISVSVNVCAGIATNDVNGSAPVIYPNPSSGRITIKANEDANATLFNQLGAAVWQFNFRRGEEISIEGLSSGMYYLVTPSTKQKIVISR